MVTPWDVAGGADGKIDYNKLVEQFGCQTIDEALVQRIERLTGRPAHPFLKRGVFFAHRSAALTPPPRRAVLHHLPALCEPLSIPRSASPTATADCATGLRHTPGLLAAFPFTSAAPLCAPPPPPPPTHDAETSQSS